jgi:hypothetical protein
MEGMNLDPEVHEWLISKCTESVLHEIHSKIKQGKKKCLGIFRIFLMGKKHN